MRGNWFRFMAIAVLLASGQAMTVSSLRADPPTRETLAALSPEEKTALYQKKVRFDALPPAEQERLRELNTAIANSNRAEELQTTLDRYYEWLKTLTTKQRADLLELPPDQRIERIKQLMQEQERARLRELRGERLPEADIDAIFNWLDAFLQEHEEEYLNRFSESHRARIKDLDAAARRRDIMRWIVFRGPRSDGPLPTGEYLDQLKPKLTPATRAALDAAKTPEEKLQLARQWAFAAMYSKAFTKASDEDLKKIYDELPAEHRERLDRKSPEDVKRELTWIYRMRQWPGREGGWRPGFGSPGFRPGGPGSGGQERGPGGPGKGPDRRGSERGPESERSERGSSDRGGERPPGRRPN
jgi:hypothetical protein